MSKFEVDTGIVEGLARTIATTINAYANEKQVRLSLYEVSAAMFLVLATAYVQAEKVEKAENENAGRGALFGRGVGA